MTKKISGVDLAAIAVCTFAWGTTWYAITWQLGHVDTLVSVVYRFFLASVILCIWCRLRGESIRLTPAQHRTAIGIGLFTFAIDYALVYLAEERVTSAIVAVVFATMSFFNLIAFRIAFSQRAPRTAWIASGMGAVGVAILSWGELTHSDADHPEAVTGILLAVGAVVGAALGNIFARRTEERGASVAAATAWGMGYGSVLLAIYVVATGREWTFDTRWPYMVALLYLAVVGSVVAFLLYYGLARRRGYSSASYIAALTPLVAMLMSTLFEGKHWGTSAIGGVALVICGQWLLLRTQKS